MKNNYKFLILSLILVLFSINSVQAQRKNRVTQKADKAFDTEMYFEASELYKKAYKKTKNKAIKAEILFKQAECYREQKKFEKAADFYAKSYKSKYDNGNPMPIYWYAKMQMANGNYKQSLKQFKNFQKLTKNKKSEKSEDIRAELGIYSCKFAIHCLSNPTRYDVSKVNALCSKSDDYSPAFGSQDYKQIYFISNRKGSSSDNVDDINGLFFTDIYSCSLNKQGTKWKDVIRLESPINTENHEGPLSLNKNGTTMFFTTCQAENKKELGCEISISKSKGKMWGSLNKLEIKVDSNTTIGHPTISSDETVVIFSADLPSGEGGQDLWIVTKVARGQWSDPANLGPAVNTKEDEMFPFLHSDGSLYFASDGHIGMGGLDIYKSERDPQTGRYVEAINLKYPINSSADDFGIIVERESERGYFSSNRSTWTGKDGVKNKSNGSDNIFSFELPPLKITLQGVITDIKTGAILTGSSVKLVGDDSSAVKYTTDNTGSYYFELNPLTTYEIIASRDGYSKNKITLTTVGIEVNKDITKNIKLAPILQDIALPRIFYEFAKWDLEDTSKLDLDIVYNIMIENPEIGIQLNSHTDFRGDDDFNMKLSQKRADTCIKYLIQKGISSDRMIPNGKGESEPYIVSKKDEKKYKKVRTLLRRKVFKEGDPLTEPAINGLKKDNHKEIAHQLNRRTTFTIIPPEIKEIEEK